MGALHVVDNEPDRESESEVLDRILAFTVPPQVESSFIERSVARAACVASDEVDDDMMRDWARGDFDDAKDIIRELHCTPDLPRDHYLYRTAGIYFRSAYYWLCEVNGWDHDTGRPYELDPSGATPGGEPT